MANNMIKFYRGLVNSLPATGENGALYITTDEGAIYYGTGTGMKRLGDFIQVANVDALPEKAHESCLYYCVAENILAKWNGTEWKQINKQPTAEEMKTLLGLGSLAYLSEVSEANLEATLKAKINTVAEGNHSHANKALLDTYTQTEADLADAVSKKHAHANADELAKIADGDKAKWDAVAADHLTSADKTTLENSIKEAKQAGTDANTNIEAYKVTNDARVKAVEDDIAEITDGTNGILAQAKSYADGKDGAIAEAKAAGTTAQSNLEAYQTSNNAALAGVKATAEAAAVKTEVETALAGKVDKVEGKSLISDSEITRLAGVTNYDDTAVKADIAKKADSATMTTELGKKVDKVEGYSLVSDTEIARLADVDNYDDTALAGRVTDLETASATHALKTEVEAVDAKFADYVKSSDYATDKAAIDEEIADRYTKEEADGKFALIADAYDDTALANRVKAIEDDYLVEADKTALQEQITANANAIELLTNGVSAEEVDGVNDLIQYVKDHGTEVTGMKSDIAANAKAIEDHEALAAETYETKDDASAKLTEAKEYADGINTALDARLDVLEAITHDAYVAADAALKAELQAEIDADVKALADGQVKTNADNIALKANAADVYAKTETFTKDEVNAAIEAAVTAAHTWGEF